MNNHSKSSKPRWMNNFEITLLGVTALISGVVSLLDMFGLLEGAKWLADRVPTLTLLMIGIVAGYLVLERRNQLEELEKDTKQGFSNLEQSVSTSASNIIDSLSGVEIKQFDSENELMRYLNKRLPQAKQQIDDLSWSSASGLLPA